MRKLGTGSSNYVAIMLAWGPAMIDRTFAWRSKESPDDGTLFPRSNMVGDERMHPAGGEHNGGNYIKQSLFFVTAPNSLPHPDRARFTSPSRVSWAQNV
jgi:hypothetical protein